MPPIRTVRAVPNQGRQLPLPDAQRHTEDWTMRSPRSLVACALLLALATLAACGGGGSSSNATASQGGSSTSGEQSSEATSSASASQSTGGGDLGSLVDALKPPNSTQISRTDASGGVFVSWQSTDSA